MTMSALKSIRRKGRNPRMNRATRTRPWSIPKRRPLLASLAAVSVGVVAFVSAYFEPQLLLINRTVHEAPPTLGSVFNAKGPTHVPTPLTVSAPRTLSMGQFRSYEHSSHGTALVLELVDGELFVRFENFATSDGPDLRVYLSTTPASGRGDNFAHDFAELGHLKGNVGDQNYFIPPSVRLRRYASVVVWCKRFDVAFAAAPLSFQS